MEEVHEAIKKRRVMKKIKELFDIFDKKKELEQKAIKKSIPLMLSNSMLICLAYREKTPGMYPSSNLSGLIELDEKDIEYFRNKYSKEYTESIEAVISKLSKEKEKLKKQII